MVRQRGNAVRTFYEFFAGGGMARAGLGDGWACTFANDFDKMKAATYALNWGSDHLAIGDVNHLKSTQLPEVADLAWASFPCQDLSLAGNYGGIGTALDASQTRSGTFWAFWKLVLELKAEDRAPRMIVLENVYGVLTAKNGGDFRAIGQCFADAGYKFGAVLIDAAHFVPQSRPRVFIVGVRHDLAVPESLVSEGANAVWHPKALQKAVEGMSDEARAAWLWWNLRLPEVQRESLESLIHSDPKDVQWHTPDETLRLLQMMSERNLAKVEQMKLAGRRWVGTIYKRTRLGVQRAELRCDGIAGCLRTPAGGSSRQLVLVVEAGTIRSRLLSAHEAALLMGLPRSYKLPAGYNDGYHVAGDGVAVPVVRHLAAEIIEPILDANPRPSKLALAA